MAGGGVKNPIDRIMERASRALEKTDYFLAERLALESLHRAHEQHDFERLARIVLPLQEARRQKRQLATDVVLEAGGNVPIVADPEFIESDPVPGCFLFQPPLIGADARAYREAANAADVPVFLLTREPLTRDGLWPIVSVGVVSVRTRVAPPWSLVRLERGMTRDEVRPETHTVPLTWFELTAERLGDSAIARLNPDDPAAWQVDDLVGFLDAFPDHEKLHQRLEEAALRAVHEDLPEGRRHRPINDDPYCF